ncbi:MAG TPA: hypothetical protein GX509_01325 [Firmicutes bacterium]|nr:hypothetical protein [Bacillota bacterium]HHY97357.1 hypothetical protein [Bacillota bacterium]
MLKAIAPGMGMDGKEHLLGLWEGAAENAAVYKGIGGPIETRDKVPRVGSRSP